MPIIINNVRRQDPGQTQRIEAQKEARSSQGRNRKERASGK